MKHQQDWRPFAAGLTSGVCNVVTGHPFDTLKVRMQTASIRPDAAMCCRNVWAGIRGPLVITPLIVGLNFGLYEHIRLRLVVACPALFTESDGRPNMLSVFTAGSLSGFLLSNVTCPLNNVKVQQQTVKGGSSIGMQEAALRVGVRGLYKAYIPNAVCLGAFRGINMFSFELAKRWLGVDSNGEGAQADLFTRFVSGSLAGAVGSATIFPIDTLRSRLMRDWQGTLYSGTWHCFKKVVQEGGVRSLYRGVSYSLIRSLPVTGVTLSAFDMTLKALKRV
eukprot:TRINITY_DN44802_c0_g1_i1.p1 TRINITY_DN44802_c0_g1~~TRINITY_DN44802_c0_g1_i1.p1  ORF type:complete len:278 (-),score=24.68 TRINITY_DN44802_c0_g1_i1:61-894(-)